MSFARTTDDSTRFWFSVGAVVLYLFAQLSPLSHLLDPGYWPLGPLWAAYGWSRGGPSVRSALVLFALGLLQDTISGGPLGLWPFAYVGAYAAALAVPAGLSENAALARAIAAALALIACASLAIITAGFSLGTMPPLSAFSISLLLTAMLTPFAGFLFSPPKGREVY